MVDDLTQRFQTQATNQMHAGRLSMLQPSQVEQRGEMMFSDALFGSTVGAKPLQPQTHRMHQEQQFQTMTRQSILSTENNRVPEELEFSRKATNEDLTQMNMKSLMMYPNHNYRIEEVSQDQYQFKYKLLEIVQKFTPNVGSYLKYSDAIKIQLTCREASKLVYNPLRKYLLRSGHLDQSLRAQLWLNHINLKEMQEKVYKMTQIPPSDQPDENQYLKIVENAKQQLDDRVKQDIQVDLNRTKTSQRVQTSEGQGELQRVLEAVAYCLPEISYCQGMNFISSVLIAEAGEENGFYVLMFLLVNHEMSTLFLPGFPELHLKNFQMAQLIKFHMPKFFQYLRKIQLSCDYFTSKWFMTIFACFLPYDLLPPIFDMFIIEGWKAVFRIGVALMKQLEPFIMNKDMTEICEFFRVKVRHEKLFDPRALYECAQHVRIHNVELQKLREKFYIIQAEVKLSERSDDWHPQQIAALEKATYELARLDPLAREDVLKFQAKLQKLDKDIDRHSKMLPHTNLDYYAAREEYTQASDKAKAINQTFTCLDQQLKLKPQRKATKKQGAFSANENNQTNMYQLDDGQVSSQENQRRLLLEDLLDIEKKKNEADKLMKQLHQDYTQKKKVYQEAQEKFEDLLQHKKNVKDQMLGFIQMYEVKKEATLMELSHSLQKTDQFKQSHIF